MVHPSVKRFVEGRTYFGLNGLDRKLEAYLPEKNGYYVELGANDGFNQSNTLFFERSKGWRGVLVEPVPKNYRKCFLVRAPENHIVNAACVSFDYSEKTVQLRYANLMTTPLTLDSDIPDPEAHVESGVQYLRKNDPVFDLEVPARTLNSILDEASAPRSIQLLSLDVEGAEMEVLKGVDHSKYRFEKILVECRDFERMNRYLSGKNYRFMANLTHHDYLFESFGPWQEGG